MHFKVEVMPLRRDFGKESHDQLSIKNDYNQ